MPTNPLSHKSGKSFHHGKWPEETELDEQIPTSSKGMNNIQAHQAGINVSVLLLSDLPLSSRLSLRRNAILAVWGISSHRHGTLVAPTMQPCTCDHCLLELASLLITAIFLHLFHKPSPRLPVVRNFWYLQQRATSTIVGVARWSKHSL